MTKKGTCSVDWCDFKPRAKGFCEAHYKRQKKYGDPEAGGSLRRRRRGLKFGSDRCTVEGCDALVSAMDYCENHYRRFRRHGDPTEGRASPGQGCINPAGYRQIVVDGKKWLEHRYVVSQYLGRTLDKTETVHHKNGVRSDNRLENLELRVGSHGPGCSVGDALNWANEILQRYKDEEDKARKLS